MEENSLLARIGQEEFQASGYMVLRTVRVQNLSYHRLMDSGLIKELTISQNVADPSKIANKVY